MHIYRSKPKKHLVIVTYRQRSKYSLKPMFVSQVHICKPILFHASHPINSMKTIVFFTISSLFFLAINNRLIFFCLVCNGKDTIARDPVLCSLFQIEILLTEAENIKQRTAQTYTDHATNTERWFQSLSHTEWEVIQTGIVHNSREKLRPGGERAPGRLQSCWE